MATETTEPAVKGDESLDVVGFRDILKGSPLRAAMVANGIAQLAPQALLFLVAPLLARKLGLAGYGLWTFCIAILGFFIALDTGTSLTLQRFLAVYRGARQFELARNLLTVACVVVGTFAVIGAALLVLAGPSVAPVIAPSKSLEGGEALQVLGAVVATAVLANLPNSYLRAISAFTHVAAGTVCGLIVFLVFVLVAPGDRDEVSFYLIGLTLQYSTVLFVSGTSAVRLGARPGLRLLPRRELVAMLRFLWRSHASGLAAFVNLQADVILIAVLFTARDVGVYGLGAIVALAFRNLPMYAALPIRTRLATLAGSSTEVLLRDAERLHRLWKRVLLAYVTCALPVALVLSYWVMSEQLIGALVVAALLCAGYAVSLLGVVPLAAVWALGYAEIEMRLGGLTVALNLGMTLPAALVAGVYGVVAATALSHILVTILGLRMCWGRLKASGRN